MTIGELLDVLVSFTAKVNAQLPSYLQPGLTPEEIYQRAPLPFKLPREVLALYQWHNGTYQDENEPEQELFFYHKFMPIEESFEVYQWRMQFNSEEGFEVFEPHLFPLFSFQGEYYATWCTVEEQERTPIFFDYHGAAQAYDNLHTMLSAIVECYETGAYYINNDDYNSDEERVAQIKAKWNASRHLPDGTIMKDHP